ncbi:MAG: nuclear transport factor 2 family protein [Pyrinomonadaceae bacterium]
MKKAYLLFAFVLCTFALISNAQTSEKDAVKVPLENYIKAHATGDPEYARKAFHTEGNMIWIREGKVAMDSFDAFIKRAFTGKPAADEEKRKDKRTVESIDIAGNAAIARIVLDYPNVKFVDYMTLLKINGEWKIVNKSFYAESRQLTEAKKGQ